MPFGDICNLEDFCGPICGAIWEAREGKILVAHKPPGAMWAMGSYDCYIPGSTIFQFSNADSFRHPEATTALKK